MAKRNHFTEYPNQWDLATWLKYCPLMTYRVLKLRELPDWLPQGLVSKFKSAVVACSGNTEVCVTVIMGLREDGLDIKEHPYVVSFNRKTSKKLHSGIIHHGNYPGRTTRIPVALLRAMEQTGIQKDFSLQRVPSKPTGTLADLHKDRILIGYEHAVRTIEKKRKSRRRKPRIHRRKT